MFRVFLILAFLAAWFLPLIIAAMYKLPHQGPIAVLSLLLGWTGAGWLAALVIAVGGAIRATRPPGETQAQGAGSAQAQGAGSAQVQSPAYAGWREPAPAPAEEPTQVPQRAQAPEWGQAQGRAPVQDQPPSPPSWPSDPR
jgi:hypothetical protein